MSNTTTNAGKDEVSNATITVELEATVEIHRRVDQGSDYVGEYVRHVDHFDDYEGIPQIICQETRNIVVHKRFEAGYPNLDAYTKGVKSLGPAEHFDQEIVNIIDISGRWDGPDWKVANYHVTITGSEPAWESQVVTWCSERPSETASQAIERFRGWSDYENVSIAGLPEQFDVSLPWDKNADDGDDDDEQAEFVTDGGRDIDLTQIEAVEDEDGNRWQVSRSYSREPTPLGGQYRSRIIISCDGVSKKLRPQTFVDQITDGTYSVRDRR